ncbi:type II restriction endonuclease [Anabaena azotica]|uniref:Type II restriction endonuclease n=1 Tax=Anabaena azotica FACHB-119 TaxID=947527 RepID=A0ABR8D020_9NOST|nr:type II restriction endonuclease [Anabaena azotica]MBD2500281.1 type II restriction endonuclease [Anabaena azotica FACHB-119]
MDSNEINFLEAIADSYGIDKNSVIFKYIERKTRASERGSKARRSLGNLYALYVLAQDYINENFEGSSFTELMQRMKAMPFGAKLQNHPLDNRLNDEVKRQYKVSDNMLPVQPANLGDGRKARKISVDLLSEHNMNPSSCASFIVDAIDSYITIIDSNQTAYLNQIEAANTDLEIAELIAEAFAYNSDARLFEIISFGLLYLHFAKTTVSFSIDGKNFSQQLTLYRTGRTNANDGGIDFVLKPLGNFFQVTETLDFKKYFLDFEKINRFPMSFVIKTNLTQKEVRDKIKKDAVQLYSVEQVEVYMNLFEEIYTLNELRNILDQIKESHDSISQLKEIVVQCFKLEYGLLD